MNNFQHGDTGLPSGSTPYLMVARRFTHFPSFLTPEWERHTKKANHPIFLENTPMFPLKQSVHTRHTTFFTLSPARNTHVYTPTRKHWFLFHMGLYYSEFEVVH